MQRFWNTAAAVCDGNIWRIELDGKPVRLPGGGVLTLSGRQLAAAVAQEWQAAGGSPGGTMSFADVPLTRLAGTAQERVAADPQASVAALLRYGETDLLCYRATTPLALAERQARSWQPWLDWATRALDAPLRTTTGIIAIEQDAAALHALERHLTAQSPAALAGLGIAVPALGSLVLGLALAEFALAADEAVTLACLDELHQEELWGTDAEAAERRRRLGDEVALAQRFLELEAAWRQNG